MPRRDLHTLHTLQAEAEPAMQEAAAGNLSTAHRRNCGSFDARPWCFRGWLGAIRTRILRAAGDAAVGRALRWMIDLAPAALEPTVCTPGKTAAFNITVLSQSLGTPLLSEGTPRPQRRHTAPRMRRHDQDASSRGPRREVPAAPRGGPEEQQPHADAGQERRGGRRP